MLDSNLPDARNHSIFHPFLVVLVSFQPFFQYDFFIFDPLDDDWNITKHNNEGYGRGKDKRHGQEQNRSRHIHRVADNSI